MGRMINWGAIYSPVFAVCVCFVLNDVAMDSDVFEN